MSGRPEELARGLAELTGHFLASGLPRLMDHAGLRRLARPERERAEWELMVFLLYCASRAAARRLRDERTQQAVLLDYYRAMAGTNSRTAFLRDLQARIDEYERDDAPAAAAAVLHGKLLPEQPADPARLAVFAELFARMSSACERVLNG